VLLRLSELPLPNTSAEQLVIYREKESGVAARGKLAEDGTVEAPLGLSDKVQQVVRQEVVVSWGGLGDHRRGAGSLDHDAVVTLARLHKTHPHQSTRIGDARRDGQVAAPPH
jgi:hypothetical protein